MGYREEFEKWLKSPALDERERAELAAVAGDDREIENRFFAPLQFGTAGLRGVMGMGTNRMNRFVVGQTTQGIASLIAGLGGDEKDRGVAVCYDCRHHSREFAEEAACVLAANGIRVRLFDAMRPTPELSFAIRRLRCIAGINITASHNTKEYNGYKAYWEDGAQLPTEHSDTVSAAIAKIDVFRGVRTMPLSEAVEKGLVTYLGAQMDEAFLSESLSLSVARDAVEKVADDFKIIYTPFHGTGYKLVPEVLRRLGMKHVLCEPKQSVPDGSFPTVRSPNPQDKEGFANAIAMAKREDVDLIIGTDPDADRVGIVVKSASGEYVTLSGNQVGCLLLDYLIRALRERGRLPAHPAFVKTIVTTDMARRIAEENGVLAVDTFTGFKFLAEEIKKLEQGGKYRYILAFEESYGYLVGDGARDKDAVTASMLIAEMAAWYRLRGMTLHEAMEGLYRTYGWYLDETINIVMPGVDGLQKTKALFERVRRTPWREIAGVPVLRMRDYLDGGVLDLGTGKREVIPLRGSNVLYFEMEDGTNFIIRPSGTEPKVRVYVLTHGESAETCEKKLRGYLDAARKLAE